MILGGAGKSLAGTVVFWCTLRVVFRVPQCEGGTGSLVWLCRSILHDVSRAGVTEELMAVQTLYHYLVERPDKGTQELYIRGTGIRASTIWHDRYISQIHPRAIAQDRD